ncbi:hypothetical protein [Mycolicibacterium sediminis]|uniref:Uncharacterized protein n=1 Tax=Mycolicibacterium sediminis TaxID=1286180 RepID=A0A7I7R144_9MYCO|nr:hypothetical protein [Mycolicibacterium sediminis]BBY31876.1 hypothetical protein MSEDJ_59720 [Mycolicibacterium sediminis]
MDFVTQWIWYLAAFLAGSLVAWLAVAIWVPYVGEQEALDAMPGSREVGTAE